MSCPHFKEGTFGICVAPNAIHVPSISEMEKYCFRSWFGACPNLSDKAGNGGSFTTEAQGHRGYPNLQRRLL